MADINTILVVEDDKVTRQMMRNVLSDKKFVVIEASLGQRSIEILMRHSVDAVLLDLCLPDAKGLEYVSNIRSHTNAPIIVVSGAEETMTKIDSLNEGADDFVSKPVDFNMLIAKINAHIRRSKMPIQNNEKLLDDGRNEGVSFGKWTVDADKFQLFDTDGKSAEFTAKEFIIVSALINQAGQTLSRRDLCEVIKDQNYIPSDRAIDIKITRIRKKLGDDVTNSQFIKTIRGVGYSFCTDL